MIVGKDFAPVSKFEEFDRRPGTHVETNRRLARYLELAGFCPGRIAESHTDGGIFFTNAVLCLPGGDSMRTAVRTQEVRACASRFLRATVQLVEPQAVATLGLQATNAVLHAFGESAVKDFSRIVEDEGGVTLANGVVVFAVPHPVASRTKAEHEAAWRRIGAWFAGDGR